MARPPRHGALCGRELCPRGGPSALRIRPVTASRTAAPALGPAWTLSVFPVRCRLPGLMLARAGVSGIRHDAIGNVHLQVLSHNDWGLLPDTRAQHLRNAGSRWLGMAERRWKWIWRTTASGAQPGKKGDRSLWATLGPPRTYCPQLPITEDNGAELIPLTTGEIRRLFNLYTRVIRHARHHERWSRWRRRHQARARYCHYQRRIGNHSL